LQRAEINLINLLDQLWLILTLTPAMSIRRMYPKDRTRVVGLIFYKTSINILKRKLFLKAVIGCLDL